MIRKILLTPFIFVAALACFALVVLSLILVRPASVVES